MSMRQSIWFRFFGRLFKATSFVASTNTKPCASNSSAAHVADVKAPARTSKPFGTPPPIPTSAIQDPSTTLKMPSRMIVDDPSLEAVATQSATLIETDSVEGLPDTVDDPKLGDMVVGDLNGLEVSERETEDNASTENVLNSSIERDLASRIQVVNRKTIPKSRLSSRKPNIRSTDFRAAPVKREKVLRKSKANCSSTWPAYTGRAKSVGVTWANSNRPSAQIIPLSRAGKSSTWTGAQSAPQVRMVSRAA